MVKQLHFNNLRNRFIKTIRIMLALVCMSSISFAQTGKSLNFDGNDDYAITASDVIGTGSYTKEAWIRIPNPSVGTFNILSQSNAASSLFVYNGILRAGQNPSYPEQVNNPTPLAANTWYHVAVTYDATTNVMQLYTNGVLVSTATAAAIVSAGEPLRIGATNVAGYGMFGDMDEVRIWNYARSASEIAGSYQCTVPPNAPGLTLYYDFEQGTANGNNAAITAITDRTTNGNDATLTNFALTGTTSNFTDASPNLTGPCSAVPVKFSAFEVKANGDVAMLHWQTATENNNSGFEIERSADGSNDWKTIGFVAGKGNASQLNDYTFTDNTPANGLNYYRLNQKDFDGNSSFSKIVSVTIAKSGTIKLYPTLTTGKVNLTMNDRNLLHTQYLIFDNNGKRVLSGMLNSVEQSIDVSTLPRGLYFLKIQNGTALKFLKQ